MTSGFGPEFIPPGSPARNCVCWAAANCLRQKRSYAARYRPDQATRGCLRSTATNALLLPLHFEHHTGDLDEMVKRRYIRALVILNPIGFFYDKGRPRGAIYESLEEFERFANKKLKTGPVQLKVTYLPVAPSQAEAALSEGMGDFVANATAVTPEREKRFAFSVPIQTNVTRIVVSGSGFGSFSNLDELAWKEIYVNPLTIAYQELRKLNDSLQKGGKAPIHVREADKNLTDDDLVQMVNADLIPATITTRERAELWSKVFDNLRAHPNVPLVTEGQTALVMRKNNPELKQLLDEFLASHGVGTSFGNTILRRYLKNTKWVKNSTSGKEMEKFRATIALFQKYAAQYDFDYLMLAGLPGIHAEPRTCAARGVRWASCRSCPDTPPPHPLTSPTWA
jgi:membrane-bound lytic murein transglycosylase MltF